MPLQSWFSPRPARIAPIHINGLQIEKFWSVEFASGWHALQAFSNFEAFHLVDSIEPELAKKVATRFVPNDPRFAEQYQIYNNSPFLIDLNISGVWDSYKGEGMVIGIVDNGINYNHVDLNVRTDIDVSYNSGDPSYGGINGFSHGTGVAGIAAAIGNNSIGVSGVAFRAQVVSIKLTAGIQTDSTEASAFAHQNSQIHIKNHSWGPTDDGRTLDGPGALGVAALRQSTITGRGGLGTIHTWAGGNGGDVDETNKDGYANSIYTIAFGATNADGSRASFSETSSSILAVTPVANGVLSTNGGAAYALTGGTSAAAPLGAGVVALILQANPNLGWRDVQDILIRTSRKVDAGNPGWITNGGGLKFNRLYGAGLVDAAAAIDLAKNSSRLNLGPHQTITRNISSSGKVIPDNNSSGVTFTFDISENNFLTEHVSVKTTLHHGTRGQLDIDLVSPAGTTSKLIPAHNDPNSHYIDWTFMSLFHWGENPNGQWKVVVRDLQAGSTGIVQSMQLNIYGATSSSGSTPTTTTVDFQDLISNFNGGQSQFDILPVIGLSNISQLKSLKITGNSNPSLLSQSAIQGTSFVYQPATGMSGVTTIALEAIDQADNKFIGDFNITVSPAQNIHVNIDSQTVDVNSGSHSVNLLPFPGVTQASQLNSLVVDSITNQGLLTSINISNGVLNFSTISNLSGETTINLSAVSNVGQPYTASVKIIVIPDNETVFVPNQVVLENSGINTIDMLFYLNLNNASELASLSIISNSNPGLFNLFEVQGSQIAFQPGANKFGVAAISISASSTSGNNYSGSFAVTVNPLTRTISFPDQEVFVNASQQSLNVVSLLGLPSPANIQSFNILSQSNPNLLSSVSYQSGNLIWFPRPDTTGENILTYSAIDNTNRPYQGTVKFVVKVEFVDAFIPNQVVLENSGVNSFSILQYLAMNIPSELKSFSVVNDSTPGLLDIQGVLDGSFTYSPISDVYGQTQISFLAEGFNGKKYIGTFQITVQPTVDVIDFPNIEVSENSGQNSIDLLDSFSLSSANQITEFNILSQTNAGLMASLQYSEGQVLFQPNPNLFGENILTYEAQASTGQPYSGSITIKVEPIVFTAFVPHQSVQENSGTHQLNMLPYLALNVPSELASINLTSNSFPALLNQARFESGLFIFEPVGGTFGVTSIQFDAITATGRPYSGAFSVTVLPSTFEVIIPELIFNENSGSQVFNILPFLNVDSPQEIQSFQIAGQSFDGLIQNVHFDQGQITFETVSNAFGNNSIFFSGNLSSGRPFLGALPIQIIPIPIQVSVPNQSIQENSGLHQIRIVDFINFNSGDSFGSLRLANNSNSSIFESFSENSGVFQIIPNSNVFGASLIQFEGLTAFGRPFFGSFSITVSPLLRDIVIPDLVVLENSGNHEVELWDYFGFESAGSLSELEITQNSNTQLIPVASIQNEVLKFETGPDIFGNAVISLDGKDVTGRPYEASLSITVVANTVSFSTPVLNVLENSGPHFVSILDSIDGVSFDDLTQLNVTSFTNQSLYSSVSLNEGVLSIFLAPDSFGSGGIDVFARDKTGRKYEGKVQIEVSPITREVILDEFLVNENSGSHSINLLPALGLATASEIKNFSLINISNDSIISDVSFGNGLFMFETGLHKFGSTVISFEATTINNRPYTGQIPIRIQPLIYQVLVPNITIEENSGQSSVPLINYFNFQEGEQLDDLRIVNISLPSLFSDHTALNGIFFYVPAENKFGSTTISFIAQSNIGRPYEGIFAVTITPAPQDIIIDELVVQENGSTESINLVPQLGISDLSELTRISILSQTNPDIMDQLSLFEGVLSVSPALNKFGDNFISFSGTFSNTREFTARIRILVQPNPEDVNISPILMAANSDPRFYDIEELLGLGEILDLNYINHTGDDIINIVSVRDNGIELQPHPVKNESSLIQLEAKLPSGRPLHINLVAIVDSYEVWKREFFTDEQITNPDLEALVWGDEADPDLDGWDNLSEYAVGGNPLKHERQTTWLSSKLVRQEDKVFQDIQLLTRTNDSRLQIIPQLSSDQESWISSVFSGDTHLELLDEAPAKKNFHSYLVRDRSSVSPTTPRFFRISFFRN